MSLVVDMRWPIARPGHVPIHHQYLLFSAISRLLPEVHESQEIGILPIRGVRINPGTLELTLASSVTIRTDSSMIPKLLPLSGKKLELAGRPIRLGVPQVRIVTGSPDLISPLVTIKGFQDENSFEAAVWRQLDTLGVPRSVSLEVGQRRVLKIKHQTIVGFRVELRGLKDADSICVQGKGIGGRRHLGCGLFVGCEQRNKDEGEL